MWRTRTELTDCITLYVWYDMVSQDTVFVGYLLGLFSGVALRVGVRVRVTGSRVESGRVCLIPALNSSVQDIFQRSYLIWTLAEERGAL